MGYFHHRDIRVLIADRTFRDKGPPNQSDIKAIIKPS